MSSLPLLLVIPMNSQTRTSLRSHIRQAPATTQPRLHLTVSKRFFCLCFCYRSLLFGLNYTMTFMPLYIYCTERAGGAKILTCAASYAALRVYHRNLGARIIAGHRRHHQNSTCRTMPCTIAALHSVSDRHTILFHPNGMSNLY